MGIETILAALLALIAGAGVGFFIRHKMAEKQNKIEQEKANSLIEKAKKDASDIKYRARKDGKEIVSEMREEFQKELRSKEDKFREKEHQLTKKEVSLDQQKEQCEKKERDLENEQEQITKRKQRVDEEIERYRKIQSDLSEKLAVVAGMTREEAKEELVAAMTEEAQTDANKKVGEIIEEAENKAEKEAKRILSIALGRFAGEYVAEKTISSVELPSDDVKGRIIGREGRNIRAFEQICGVDLVIDDTPETVVISSFNVIRREIARRTLEMLLSDGRIHPQKIEEFHDKAKAELDEQIKMLGEKAMLEVGVHNLHPELQKIVGSLNWRTSYTQNQYQHSLEVGLLCGAIAAELNLNVKQARRAGLLHDIGKCIDASMEGSHAMIGADYAKKYGESSDIVHAIRAHHHDVEPETVLSHIVIAADGLSAARPGVRKAMMESYVSRLADIENIVNDFEGVASSYAFSAGREVRVLVQNEQINDDQTVALSRDIAKKIETEMSYPGSIKVTVVRETKAVGIAK